MKIRVKYFMHDGYKMAVQFLTALIFVQGSADLQPLRLFHIGFIYVCESFSH